MIKALKGGEAFSFLYSAYYKVILDIAVYSFSDDQVSFNELLGMLKQVFLDNFEQIEKSSLLTLLEALVARMSSFNESWFKQQKKVNDFLSGILAMIDQNKVPGKFD